MMNNKSRIVSSTNSGFALLLICFTVCALLTCGTEAKHRKKGVFVVPKLRTLGSLFGFAHDLMDSFCPLGEITKIIEDADCLFCPEIPKVAKVKKVKIAKTTEKTESQVDYLKEIIKILEQQGKIIQGDKAPHTNPPLDVMNTGMQMVKWIEKALADSENKIRTTQKDADKKMDQVVQVVKSKNNSLVCVTVDDQKQHKEPECKTCQNIIPDFVDKIRIKEETEPLVKNITVAHVAKNIEDYLGMAVRVGVITVRYSDKLIQCMHDKKNMSDCRIRDKESAILQLFLDLLQSGQSLTQFIVDRGSLVTNKIENGISRVSTTHKCYEQCLKCAAGEPQGSQIIHKKEELEKYFDKMEGRINTLDQVAKSTYEYRRRKHTHRHT